MYAFKCNNCGTLVKADAAGERSLPSACPHCGWGVRFDPISGSRSFVDENWTILADLTGDALTEFSAAYGEVDIAPAPNR